MKKKTLIAPLLATMLAVSCGGGSTPVVPPKDWSEEVKELMTQEIGEVLPYLALDEETLVFTHDADEFGGYAHAYDDNATNLVADYGAVLEEAGFVFDEESEEYYKQNEKAEIWIWLSFYEGEEPSEEDPEAEVELPGNIMHVEYLYNEVPEGDWSADVKAEMLAAFGEVVPYAFFDEETLTTFNDYEEGSFDGTYYIDDERSTSALISYARRLVKAGYEPTVKGYFVKDTELGQIAVYGEWYEASDLYPEGNEIEVIYELKSVTVSEFPTATIKNFFETYVLGEGEEYSVVDYTTATENPSFVMEYELNFDELYARFDVYAYGGQTAAELEAYAYALVDAGWYCAYADEDYTLYNPEGSFYIQILDYTGWGEEYSALFSFVFDITFHPGYTNRAMALTSARKLGLPFSEVKDVSVEGQPAAYSILTSIKGSLDEVRALTQSLIPSDYYSFSEDLSSVYYSEEDPSVIEGYDDIYVVDGFETGKQYAEVMMYPNLEVEGEIAVIISFAGAPVEPTWTAKEAIDAIFAAFGLPWEPEDYSEDYGIPAFGTGIAFGSSTTVASAKKYVLSLMNEDIKGFYLAQNWTEGEFKDGTPYVECVYACNGETAQTQIYFDVYVSGGTTILEILVVDIPANPEA